MSPPPVLPSDLWLLTLSFLPSENIALFGSVSKMAYQQSREALKRRAQSYGFELSCNMRVPRWLALLFKEVRQLWDNQQICLTYSSPPKQLLPPPFFRSEKRGVFFRKERLLYDATLALWPQLKAAEIFSLFSSSFAYSDSRLFTHYLASLVEAKKIRPTNSPAERRLGGRALSWAVYFEWSNQSQAVKLLLQLKADPNYTSSNDLEAPLHTAAIRGSFGIAAMLLQAKASVDQKGPGGHTPLTFAVAGGHRDVAELLLAFGASPA